MKDGDEGKEGAGNEEEVVDEDETEGGRGGASGIEG